jgi:DNA-directed RNA polymerase subunit M/transcription elongation factor TFIIS
MSPRALAALHFSKHLPVLTAHALEHACHIQATAHRVSYDRTVFRALHLLESREIGPDDVERLGTHAIAGGPLEVIVGRVPQREQIHRSAEARAKSRTLLRDLTQGEIADIPDAGLKCKRCHSNDITYEFLQTRSADEGTTIFCTCGNCSKRWKM